MVILLDFSGEKNPILVIFQKNIEFQNFHNNVKFHTQNNWLKWWHLNKQTLTLNIVQFHIFYTDGDGEIINNPVREYARNRYLDALLLVK
jgi:hypothetical protein